MKPELLEPLPPSSFVCTACGGKFAERALLDGHWLETPDCSRRKNLGTSLAKADEEDLPGIATLRLVRKQAEIDQ